MMMPTISERGAWKEGRIEGRGKRRVRRRLLPIPVPCHGGSKKSHGKKRGKDRCGREGTGSEPTGQREASIHISPPPSLPSSCDPTRQAEAVPPTETSLPPPTWARNAISPPSPFSSFPSPLS